MKLRWSLESDPEQIRQQMSTTTGSEDVRGNLSGETEVHVAAKFFRGLADPTRLRIVVLLLERGELTVGEVVEALDGLQGRISSHLACLRHCGLVTGRKVGRNVYYSVPDPRVQDFLPVALGIAADNADHIASCHRIGDGP